MNVFDLILFLAMLPVLMVFGYMASHMVSEKKEGRRLRLPWEKDD